MGPSPREDHYFFGRLDLSDSVDRQDYLSGDSSLQNRMLGGVIEAVQVPIQAHRLFLDDLRRPR